MAVEAAYVFPVFCYFCRAGSVLCALDGFDEAVPRMTHAGFLELFAELAEVLSAESAVVMTSRVSFLEDSPPVRRLMDGTSLISEQLVQELHAQGVDPLQVPRFSVLRLHEAGGSLLGAQLAGRAVAPAGSPDLAGLLWRHISRVVPPALVPRAVEFFGLAFLRGVTTFTLAELVNELGISVFDGWRVGMDEFRLAPLFRAAGFPGDREGGTAGVAVTFRHAAYQELLAAEVLRTAEGRDAVIAVTGGRPRLTEQVREFLCSRSAAPAVADDGALPAGAYLVGPSHHLILQPAWTSSSPTAASTPCWPTPWPCSA